MSDKELKSRDDVSSVEPLAVDGKKAAVMIGVSERTVRNLVRSGELPVVRIAKRVLYSIEDLTEFIRQRSRREPSSGNE